MDACTLLLYAIVGGAVGIWIGPILEGMVPPPTPLTDDERRANIERTWRLMQPAPFPTLSPFWRKHPLLLCVLNLPIPIGVVAALLGYW